MTATSRLILLTTLLTGCFSRQIVSIEDGPQAASGQTTLLTTIDVRNYLLFGVTKRVFWECGAQGGGLSCEQVCDVPNDQGDKLMCPTVTGGVL